jgi:hypothetical protein
MSKIKKKFSELVKNIFVILDFLIKNKIFLFYKLFKFIHDMYLLNI